MDDAIKARTQETANKLFSKGVKIEPSYRLWKEFDRDLANDFSTFITGNLYSRSVLTLPERQMVACAMLAALGARRGAALTRERCLERRLRPPEAHRGFLSARHLRRNAEGQRGARRVPGRFEGEGRVAHQIG